LGCIRVQSLPDGTVSFQGTDLDSFATCRLSIASGSAFPASLVEFKPLAGLTKKARDRITLIWDEFGQVRARYLVGSSPVEQVLETLLPHEWPCLPEIDATSFVVGPGFKPVLREALECVSTDPSRYIVNGVCLDVSQPDCHYVVATDGRHLYTANSYRFDLTGPVVIPSLKFLNWPAFLQDGDWSVAVGSSKEEQPPWVQIQSDHWTLLTEAIKGPYPDWRQVVPDPERKVTKLTLSPQAVTLMREALPRLPDDGRPERRVRLVVTAGTLALGAQGKGSQSWTQIPVPSVNIDGPDKQITLDRTYLSKALRFGFTELEIEGEEDPVLFPGVGKNMVVGAICT
jgi:hypothetical protein